MTETNISKEQPHQINQLTSINTTPLLEEHNQPSNTNPLEVIHSAEAIGILRNLIHENTLLLPIRKLRRSLRKSALLKDSLSLNLKVFHLDKLMLNRNLAHPRQSL